MYSLATSVAMAAQRATNTVPIVLYAGRDAVDAGLVKSLAKPGGRLTGVQSRTTDVSAKWLEILKELDPKLRRVMGFHNPDDPTARESSRLARDATRQLRIVNGVSKGRLERTRGGRRPRKRDGVSVEVELNGRSFASGVGDAFGRVRFDSTGDIDLPKMPASG